jgi:hypothetical protein
VPPPSHGPHEQANKAILKHGNGALNRHRGKGQQKVTVEHVHVHDGGQAIVGNVQAGGGVASKPEGQPHAIAYAPGQIMQERALAGEPEPAGAIGRKADMPSGH